LILYDKRMIVIVLTRLYLCPRQHNLAGRANAILYVGVGVRTTPCLFVLKGEF